MRPLPSSIRVDHGTEFTSKALDEWTCQRGVQLDYIRHGKPTENGMIESSKGRLRDEHLNYNEFESLQVAEERIEAWRNDHNDYRPHNSLGNLTPNDYEELYHSPGPKIG